MKIAFYTLGCKVNQYESQVMGEVFSKSGHEIVSDTKKADCVVINSCTVTAESDRKTRQAVRRFRRLLPEAVIIIAGCMPQAFPLDAEGLLQADIVTGNTAPEKISLLLDSFLKTGERIIKIEPHEKCEKYSTPSISGFSERTRAFMKVEDGCDRFCTYCIIPKSRGVVRSKPLAEIEAEAENLAQKGFKEIVLVGINLTSYGKDCGLTICDAVDAAAKPNGIERVRLGSLEPDHISDITLERLSLQKKFCPQFHLALQSGSDEVLKRMNRRYDKAFYMDLVGRIRDRFENPSITTDIMVGFPGEEDREFDESLNFFNDVGFARAHVFSYSKRIGTIAAALPNQVDPAKKEERARILGSAAKKSEEDFLKTQLEREVTVLFEIQKDGFAEGYTENYTRVKVKTEKRLSGKLLKVKLTRALTDCCIGELV